MTSEVLSFSGAAVQRWWTRHRAEKSPDRRGPTVEDVEDFPAVVTPVKSQCRYLNFNPDSLQILQKRTRKNENRPDLIESFKLGRLKIGNDFFALVKALLRHFNLRTTKIGPKVQEPTKS